MQPRSFDQRTWQLLYCLADGDFHSGQVLAAQLGVSRATIFNVLAELPSYGVVLQRVRGRGYRLGQAWQALEVHSICAALGEFSPRFTLEIVPLATSSNALLLQHATQGAASGSVLAVELQTAGRGRIGRAWHSSLGNALTFSLLWRFAGGLNSLSGLSLAVGVAIVRALRPLGATEVGLKWPNDVMAQGAKLGGVLIEAQGDMLGPCAVVIGIGLNCQLPMALAQRIDQAACALDELGVRTASRNQILAAVLRELATVLDDFAAHGFAPLRAEWQRYHAQQDQPIHLLMPTGELLSGVARGVAEGGELRVEIAGGIRNFNSGEVRVLAR